MCFINIIKINYTISYDIQIFSTHLYHVAVQLVKANFSLDMTTVFLMQMEELVCSNILILTRKQSEIYQGENIEIAQLLISIVRNNQH